MRVCVLLEQVKHSARACMFVHTMQTLQNDEAEPMDLFPDERRTRKTPTLSELFGSFHTKGGVSTLPGDAAAVPPTMWRSNEVSLHAGELSIPNP